MIVRYEDGKWINNIGVYFEIIKEINVTLKKLLKSDTQYNSRIEVLFFDISCNLSRLIPIRHHKLDHSEGILKLKKYFDFLKKDYTSLFKKYDKELLIINDMRNKFEHCPHIIKWKSYIGGNNYKKMVFVNDEYSMVIFEGKTDLIDIKQKSKEYLEWIIDTNTLIDIVILINKIFIEIQKQLNNYFIHDTEALNHPYIKNILEIDLRKLINDLR